MELFELYLSPNQHPTRFRAIVTQSPASEGETESSLPFFEGENDWRTTLIKTLESTSFNPKNFPKLGEQDWMVKVGILTSDRSAFDPHRLKTIGRSLYQALFPPGSKVEKALQSALRVAEGKNTQLHIQFKFEADSVQRLRLADYPWELIHDGQRFLAHYQVTFSRYIAHDTVPPNLPPVEQMNVLLVSSAAFDPDEGLKQLSTQEQQAIYQGLQNAQQTGHIRLFKLERATQNQLRAYLTEHRGAEAPHVLHFDGHGLFGKRCLNEQCGTIHKGIKADRCRVCNTALPEAQGYMVFEDEQGQPDYVSAKELGAMLHLSSFTDSDRQSSRVALTVLSACQSGMAVAGDSVFNGTAQNLIGHRIPAVVAMQYSVSVQSATKFAEQFYRSLGQKNSLAIAVSQGREAMGAEGNQWYRPVLYLRWQDNQGGQLFAASNTIASPIALTSNPVDQLVAPPPLPTPPLPGLVKPVHPVWLSGLSLRTILTISLMVTGTLIGLRFFGQLEWLELKAFDHLMQLRGDEGVDSRLLIVEITDNDILAQNSRQEKGQGTLADPSLNRLLDRLEPHKPRLIGLDLYRDFPADPTVPGLVENMGQNHFYAVCKVPETDQHGKKIAPGIDPPKELAPERIGFSDFVVDIDNTVRRHLMALEPLPGSACRTERSFSLLLAHRYLQLEPGKNSEYHNPFRSGKNLQLGGILFQKLQPFTGGYQDVNADGFQVLLNYRATGSGAANVAKRLTLEQVLNNQFDPEDVHDKIVLIGVTATQGIHDNWSTPYGTIPGIIVHAQMISQILSAVLDSRPLLQVWSQYIEILWIGGWSFVGGILAGYMRSPKHLGIATGGGVLVLYLTCLISLTVGNLWIPLIPSALALVGTSGIVKYMAFLSRDRTARLPHQS
ncbi:MAG: CHASE2 domain-containing protein [Coleofasciculus sp. A1-SPW-01]|uniref:CHASE2 domain-containing protein n=1 Tax=Coleofasciculus sp. A1-SPW-01 TaxID=3070819 RepID=UPI0032FA9899